MMRSLRRFLCCHIVGIVLILTDALDDDLSLTASTPVAVNTAAANEALLADIDASQVSATGSHWHWMWGVFVAIAAVICIFVALVLYLVGAGIFSDDGSVSKSYKCEQTQRSQCGTATRKRKTTSPKKQLHINITYHSPENAAAKTDTIANARLSPCMEHPDDVDSGDDDEENEGDDGGMGVDPEQLQKDTAIDIKTSEHRCHKRHRGSILCNEGSETTTTCDTKIIHHSCDFDPSTLTDAITDSKDCSNVTPTGSDNEYEASIVRYVITCSSERSRVAAIE